METHLYQQLDILRACLALHAAGHKPRSFHECLGGDGDLTTLVESAAAAARWQYSCGRWGEAAESYSELLSTIPEHRFTGWLYARSAARRKANQISAGLADIEEALSLQPGKGSSAYYNLRAVLHMELGAVARAGEDIGTTFRLCKSERQPPCAVFHHNRGRFLELQGKLDEAEKALLLARDLQRLSIDEDLTSGLWGQERDVRAEIGLRQGKKLLSRFCAHYQRITGLLSQDVTH
eukprot:SAG31_NODE_7384_length_1704_cov_1.095327_1_plen_236_part_00